MLAKQLKTIDTSIVSPLDNSFLNKLVVINNNSSLLSKFKAAI